MRKHTIVCMSSLIVYLLAVNTLTFAATPVGESIAERANHAYNPDRKNTQLRVAQDGEVQEFKYNERFIPVRDLFGPYVDRIKWDNKRKIATIQNNGTELVLHFSDEKFEASDSQVIVPKEWIRMYKGRSEINASVITYLFDKYSDAYDDEERDQWQEKLAFLGIKESEGIPGARDSFIYVFITFNDKESTQNRN